MTLRAFLNAGFALLVEAYTGLGVNIVEAVERAWESLGVEKTEKERGLSTEAQNEASLARLNQMMAGVQ